MVHPILLSSNQSPRDVQYDTGQVCLLSIELSEPLRPLQISDILLMSDFKLRFAQCSTAGDASSCEFSRVREGLIVALLSIGTLIGALSGAPYVILPLTNVHPRHDRQKHRRFLRSSECNVAGVYCLHRWCNYSGYRFHLLGSGCSWSAYQRPRCWCSQHHSSHCSFLDLHVVQFYF